MFELPQPFIEPTLRAFRLVNTVLDAMFYDVGVLMSELLWRGEVVTTQTSRTALDTEAAPHRGPSFSRIDLSALSNPEGCILVVDSAKAPFITRYDDVGAFITWAKSAGTDVETVTITGVGSSALGSAALAWNVSMALGQRVAAIVPGYGVADVMNQALGGWFGFGVHDWFATWSQTMLAHTAPRTARIGHHLLASIPGHPAGEGKPLEFRTGSAASDVLHSLIEGVPRLTNILGHSKGALAIANALLSLDGVTGHLRVTTFGCPIAETVKIKKYDQFLGTLDAIGVLNSWGHKAEHRPVSHHSTNTMMPFATPVAILSRLALACERPDAGLLSPPSTPPIPTLPPAISVGLAPRQRAKPVIAVARPVSPVPAGISD